VEKVKTKRWKARTTIIAAILVLTLVILGCMEKRANENIGDENKSHERVRKILFESARDAPLKDGDFQKNPQKYIELFSMNLDGSDVRRLTYNYYWEHKPQFSHGSILVSIHFSPGRVLETDAGWEIAVLDISNSNFSRLKRLTNNSYLDIDAKWNRDGTKIVYVSDSNKRTADELKMGLLPQYDIYIMNSDGSGKKRLTFGKPGEVNADPCFSPDGDIYYVHSEGFSNKFDLWKMEGDGSNKTPVLIHNNLIKSINDPSVSKDGKRIIFEGKISSGKYNLFVLELEGLKLRRITYDDGESDIWPSFSSDGTYIVYFTYKGDQENHTQKIRISKSDGSEEKEISTFPWESFPTWFEDDSI